MTSGIFFPCLAEAENISAWRGRSSAQCETTQLVPGFGGKLEPLRKFEKDSPWLLMFGVAGLTLNSSKNGNYLGLQIKLGGGGEETPHNLITSKSVLYLTRRMLLAD